MAAGERHDRLRRHDMARTSESSIDRDGAITTVRSRSFPGIPDAAFIAVPNQEAPHVATALAARGAGGFVCFTSGFSETGTEAGAELTRDLTNGAGTLPFFGPNCYGFVNFFDRVAMMPDQIVGQPVQRGVALICQSGTIALTLMFGDRSLPIGYLITVGNQTRLAVEDLIETLCDDPRVTAFGLYLEGIKNAERFAGAADKARVAGKADRRGQSRAHGGRGAHRAQPHGRTCRRRRRVRRFLPPSGDWPVATLWEPFARL